jgi:hypothetical protein
MSDRLLVVVLAFAGVTACYQSRLPPGACENEQLSELTSTDGQWKSVLFERRCAQEVSINVSVLPATATLPNEPGNAFRESAMWKRSRSALVLRQTWKGPDQLWIAHDEEMKVVFAASEVGPVRVFHSVGDLPES